MPETLRNCMRTNAHSTTETPSRRALSAPPQRAQKACDLGRTSCSHMGPFGSASRITLQRIAASRTALGRRGTNLPIHDRTSAKARLRPEPTSMLTSPPLSNKAISGTVAVCLILAATRWGSYIGIAPLYLTDILIALAFLSAYIDRQRIPRIREINFRPPAQLQIIVGYALMRMLLSGDYAGTLVAFRDAVPYLYAIIGLLSARSYASASRAGQAKTMNLVWIALIAHLTWITIIGFVSAASLQVPRTGFGAGLFSPRPDIDCAVLGITAGLLLQRLILNRRRRWATFGLAMTILASSNFTTRAGVISIALCIATSFAYTYKELDRKSARRVGLLTLVPVLAILIITLAPRTVIGQRLEATVSSGHASNSAQENAQGTANARLNTWKGVISWTTESDVRLFFGAGMGIDFLAESGTLKNLEGSDYDNVRSPHNYYVGTFARLGLLGLLLVLMAILSAIASTIRNRRAIAEDEFLRMSALTLLAILPVASLGVVLESPFGAVPFWWAVGTLLYLNSQRARSGSVPPAQAPSMPSIPSPLRYTRTPSEPCDSRYIAQ